MKRKGSDTISPGLSVVVHSPYDDESNINEEMKGTNTPTAAASTPLSILSPYSPTSSRTWEETRDTVDKILLQFEGPNAQNDVALVKKNNEIIKTIEDNVHELKLKSEKIKSQIQSKIDLCVAEMENEAESIRFQRERIEEMENEVVDIKKNTSDMIKVEKELKSKIDEYKSLASQEVEQIDEVEEEKKAEVYRLQKHISLLALVSGIKWDYDCVDSIAGEVEIPSTGKHVRFEIDRDNHTSFEIANILWDTIAAR